MPNFKDEIVQFVGKEKIEAIVIGKKGYVEKDDPIGFITWKKVQEILDYEYDDGFGGADCHPIFIWTATRVIFVHEYDGATWLTAVPRNPVNCEPFFSGGYTIDNK